MRGAILAVLLGPGTVHAASFTCQFDGLELSFEIDPNQFVPPQSEGEPPRRQSTVVMANGSPRPAVPFVLGEFVGFSTEGLGGTESILMIEPDGGAQLTNARAGTRQTGACLRQ